MSLSNAISNVYSLNFFEQKTIATIFAYYFLQTVTTPENAKAFLKNTTALNLGTGVEIGDVLKRIDDVLNKPTMTFDDACKVVGSIGIDRLSSVNRRFIYNKLKSIGPDINTSAIAMEYPPYFAYLLLLALSGRKIGMLDKIKSNGLMKEAVQFTTDLINTQSFIPEL